MNDGPSKFNPEYDPLGGMRGDLAELHRSYSSGGAEKIKKRRIPKPKPIFPLYTRDTPKTHVTTGSVEQIPPRVNFYIKDLEKFQIRFKSEDFKDVDTDLRFLLAVGSSNHPANSNIFNTPAEKRAYIKDIINLGQDLVLTEEGLNHVIDGAVERGTICLGKAGTAQLTDEGLEAIESADSMHHASRGQGFNFD